MLASSENVQAENTAPFTFSKQIESNQDWITT